LLSIKCDLCESAKNKRTQDPREKQKKLHSDSSSVWYSIQTMGGKSSKDKESKGEHKESKSRKLTRKISRTFSSNRGSKKPRYVKPEEAQPEPPKAPEEPPKPETPPTAQQNETPKPPPLSPEENTTMPKLEFHAQIAQSEIQAREEELRQFTSKKEACAVFEENPFKKGMCRNCKNTEAEHRDAYADILAGLDEV